MTLNDFLKRFDLKKDKDKMLLHCDVNGGWANLDIEVDQCVIRLLPSKHNSPFSDDN